MYMQYSKQELNDPIQIQPFYKICFQSLLVRPTGLQSVTVQMVAWQYCTRISPFLGMAGHFEFDYLLSIIYPYRHNISRTLATSSLIIHRRCSGAIKDKALIVQPYTTNI